MLPKGLCCHLLVFTNDCTTVNNATTGTHILKFADDTCIQGLIFEEETNYRESKYWFVKWCEEHFLLLNVKKTKEMIIDFRRNKNPLTLVLINNEEVERVESYKYLRQCFKIGTPYYDPFEEAKHSIILFTNTLFFSC